MGKTKNSYMPSICDCGCQCCNECDECHCGFWSVPSEEPFEDPEMEHDTCEFGVKECI